MHKLKNAQTNQSSNRYDWMLNSWWPSEYFFHQKQSNQYSVTSYSTVNDLIHNEPIAI